ncbi:UBA/TS-N domain containing protein [Histomonas meleagridis]|uniref:UBA/TS-N domain containing protein n=1 Tax=Histomonas meleagridis TaxID=135588 RepID=UPI003559C66A|nr:UBA/TS-N domain containing protein [Histomonas meleagridis]KAH0805818.1 UBA/TS-N domain containing protein [Histomonas meleagridis]
MEFSDEEEIIIGDDEDFDMKIDSSNDIGFVIPDFSQINYNIKIFSSFFKTYTIKATGSNIYIAIPSSVLPPSIQMIGGFHFSKILLEINVIISGYNWHSGIEKLDVSHPLYKRNYIGRPLVEAAIRNFFSPSYKPKPTYSSISYVFSEISNSNNFNNRCKPITTQLIDLNNCHLLYLIYEIVEAFLDLNNHCCICRKRLPNSGIKPSICESRLCSVAFQEIGVGTSVAQEIRRDPLAADFLFTIFGTSLKSGYCNPSPPLNLFNVGKNLLSQLPSMRQIASSCLTDADITRQFGKDTLDFLRWLLLSNKSHIITLPSSLQVKQQNHNIPTNFQFMTLISDQFAEDIFQKKKKKNHGRSLYMWHGSGADRWHSIVRNGLKNMSKVPGGVIHGTAYGEGIYFAKNSSMSFDYSSKMSNKYIASELPKNLTMIALCEVVPNASLSDHGSLYTLKDESACIVRFVMVTESSFSFDPTQNSFTVPTLYDVLNFQEQQAKQNN